MKKQVKKYLSLTLVGMAFLVPVKTAWSDSAAPGVAKMCSGCHGKDGISSRELVPTIAGISVGVQADYLYAYKEGSRVCTDAKTKAMCTMTAKLSDDQIEELAEYYAAMEYRPVQQEFDADKATAGAAIHDEKCGKCHTRGGSDPDDESSILAGQPLSYLLMSLKQFAAGERDQPAAMESKTVGMSEADIEALAHYYASQQ